MEERPEDKIIRLEKENAYLKSLLKLHGIKYDADNCSLFKKVSENNVRYFLSFFFVRADVYARRVISKKTGKASYYPQCSNFWKDGCFRKSGEKISCSKCPMKNYRPLNQEVILKHLNDTSGDFVIGGYPLLEDNTCKMIVFDFDNHESDNKAWQEEVNTIRKICELNNIPCLVERSRSGNGGHVWIFFEEAIEAKKAREFGEGLLNKGKELVNIKSFDYYDRLFPSQDYLKDNGIGNLVALPLQGYALNNGNSCFVDESFVPYVDQWLALYNCKKVKKSFVEEKLKEWSKDKNEFALNLDGEKPWEKTRCLDSDDVNGKLEITLSNGIYINTLNLKPRIQNRIRELASYSNPEYYKALHSGSYGFNTKRFIYLGYDEGDYIHLPYGLYDTLIEKCEEANIAYQINDKRNCGTEIDVTFKGELKERQSAAVESLLKHDNGILLAATAFGKTVSMINVISRLKVNTLILLGSSSLVDQWESELNSFLVFNSELPTYETKNGIRKRKSHIGIHQGQKDTTNGIVDIMMAGSLFDKDGVHPRFHDYGLIIVDECHHVAASTLTRIMNEAKAKYIYGASAGNERSDGHEMSNLMLLGPIRYNYSIKQRNMESGIKHYVIPRFTRTISTFKDISLQEAYKLIEEDELRDSLIIDDIVKCLKDNRKIVVLTQRVNHAKRLFDKIVNICPESFLLVGNQKKNEQKEVVDRLKEIDESKGLVLVSTGQLIGEGFNMPFLDTLFLAMPVSGEGVVKQYAGRINRTYSGKESELIYDYVDNNIDVTRKMYLKRLKAYKSAGYSLYESEDNLSDDNADSIYDSDNYKDVFIKDISSARKEIIISSVSLYGNRIHEFADLVKERQAEGVTVTVVTYEESIRTDNVRRLKLIQDMRDYGFNVKLIEDNCLKYCVIDSSVVWYGSINYLGKEDIEDSAMRIHDKGIVENLLYQTFKEK